MAKGRASGRARISVVGAGAFARSVLLPSLTREGASLRAVLTATGLSARSAAEGFGFSTYSTSVDTVWRDGDCDGVVIATRHDSHAQLTIVLEAGEAVLVEKPPVCHRGRTRPHRPRRGHLARRWANAVLMVAFNRRFAPTADAVRRAIAGVPISIVCPSERGPRAARAGSRVQRKGRRTLSRGGMSFRRSLHTLRIHRSLEVSVTRSAAGPDDVMIGLRMANRSIATVAYMIDGDRAASKHRGVRRRTPRDNRRFSACTRQRKRAAIEARGMLARQNKGRRGSERVRPRRILSDGLTRVAGLGHQHHAPRSRSSGHSNRRPRPRAVMDTSASHVIRNVPAAITSAH